MIIGGKSIATGRSHAKYPSLWQSLVGIWSPDLSPVTVGGTARDYSGLNHHGTFSNMDPTDWVVDRGGRAFDLDGTNDSVDCGDLGVSLPFSLCAWAGGLSAADTSVLLSVGDTAGSAYNAIYWQGATTTLKARSFDGTTAADAEATLDMSSGWHCIVGVFHSVSNRKLWANGALVDTNSTAVTNFTRNGARIGVSADSTPFGYCSGRVGLTMVFDRAITPDEIGILCRGASPLTKQRIYVAKSPAVSSIPVIMHHRRLQGMI